MLNIILFDDNFENLKPLTFTRPVGALRVGILTIQEKWQKIFNTTVSFATESYLAAKYPLQVATDNLLINAAVLPSKALISFLQNDLPADTILKQGNQVIAVRLNASQTNAFLVGDYPIKQTLELSLDLTTIVYPWHIFQNNDAAIKFDFELLTKGRKSQTLSASNRVIGDANLVFLEEGAWAECAIFNTNDGPIYIGKNATVMEGSIIRGSFALCHNSTTKMAAKIYGPTTIGPHSKVGGEINNAVILGYSNKGHDGFLGNSVIGEWCNLGADTNNSNLKNNYGSVRVWNYAKQSFINTELQFCGLIMGDHSKSGINTMFNTGTVIGAFCNVYGSDFPRKFVPSFSWGSSKGFITYKMNKVLETAERVMSRRAIKLDAVEISILEYIFEKTKKNRKY